MDAATQKAMNKLADQTAQMRHEAVDEINVRIWELISEIARDISENYIVLDKQTDEPVELSTRDLNDMIDDSAWGQWQHKMIELLKFNDDVTLDRMQQIVESQHASHEHAPTNQPTQHPRSTPIRPSGVPVGHIQCINILDALGRISSSQQAVLRSAIDYLAAVPAVVDQSTAAQEAQAIANMKHLIYAQWAAEASRARHIFSLLMWAHGNGFDDPATDTIQELLTGMDLN
jgi:hypothetical protein